jgi:uncharacterized protein
MTTAVQTAPPPVAIPTWAPSRVLATWAAAGGPMAALAWLVAPALARAFTGPTAMPRALVLCLGAGLIWQLVLVLLIVRIEQRTLRWAVIREALWLKAPTSPRSGSRGGRLWWVVVPLMLLLALEELVPSPPNPAGRDLAAFFGSTTGQSWMSGNWGWFAALIVLFIFNTALGEELLFRGLLLPRMGCFGKWDWLVNGALFAAYHLHEPWVIPQTILVDTFALALPSRRLRSSLIGIIVHSSQTVFFCLIGLTLVLR